MDFDSVVFRTVDQNPLFLIFGVFLIAPNFKWKNKYDLELKMDETIWFHIEKMFILV